MMRLDLQPRLSDGVLSLRPMAAGDFEPLWTAASDPLIWEQHPAPDRHRREVFAGYFQSGLASGGALVALAGVGGPMIGSSRYYDYEPEARTVKIGYTFLARAYWGGHYNRSLKRLMLDHAFGAVEAVCFEVGENNRRSQTAVERLGAEWIDRRARPVAAGAPPGWNLIYRITAAAWSLRTGAEAPAKRTP